MDTFKLFDYDGQPWENIKTALELAPFKSMEDFYNFVNSKYHLECAEFVTVENLLGVYPPDRFLKVVNFLRQVSLSLPTYFPTGHIPRLSNNVRVLTFSRRQVLVLLSHMFFCTLTPTALHNYWVTFHNWLTDGRGCALAYLQCLLGYFEESMDQSGGDLDSHTDFWKEMVTFERHQSHPSTIIDRITTNSSVLTIPTVYSDGQMGDSSVIEIDFANMDIGFGIYGTQEEILFGGRPEMCIGMLFTDTMTQTESIHIKGARKVGTFTGYGSSLQFHSLVDPVDPDRNERLIIAVDALDFSSYENPLDIQFNPEQMLREIGKLVAGFYPLPPGSRVDTGNWGCGAFCGDKRLKALLQIIAATLTGIHLSFYTFGDSEFAIELEEVSKFIATNALTVNWIWEFLNQCHKSLEINTNVFVEITKFVNKKPL